MAKANKTSVKGHSSRALAGKKIDRVSIRMYCLGTGDCLILKFLSGSATRFTAMIDCGSCQGTAEDFKPYIQHLASYVGKHLDLLVVTHEHNDHVNGFAKCEDIFKQFMIGEAWFAWTEDSEDPKGRARQLQEKRKKMKQALGKAIRAMKVKASAFESRPEEDRYKQAIVDSDKAFIAGLDTLAEINLSVGGEDPGASLPGMLKIK